MVLRFNVGGKVVERVDLIKKKKWPWGLDIFPFAILYAIWMITIVPSIDIVDALIVLGGLVSTHVLALLFTALFNIANDIYAADSCKVTPAKFSGSKEIVPLHIRQQESEK
ncbi:hypothetical protein D5086_032706 [Populus alba]|uniref:Uncharacterized protein n=1 Tax=Populus alba TaxID=43335 RepID=A0ACC4AEV7_POPAL